jgi:hypothetical protein
VKEVERLRVLSIRSEQQRESWRHRALVAVPKPATMVIVRMPVTSSMFRSSAIWQRFHPDYAPGQGIEKTVRNEVFKEIWSEIERLD